MRGLIVNADDFGHSEPVNAGIVDAFELGIVTSASLMVRRQAAELAAAYAGAHPRLSLGLHVDLGDWSYSDEAGWVSVDAIDDGAVEEELTRQLDGFRALVGRDPTHLDSHHHAHCREPARTPLLRLAQTLGVPLRHFDPRVRYRGDFYGQTDRGEPRPERITAEALLAVLGSLEDALTELGCHPGREGVQGSGYAAEREQECRSLCDSRVRAAVDRLGIRLMSFADLAALR